MVEGDTKTIDLIELGIGKSNESTLVLAQTANPTVLRDKRARIRWTLPRNTIEENEQLGIRNIQVLFTEKFPEFETLFPRRENGKIGANMRRVAREFVLDKVGTKVTFCATLGYSAINKHTASYFEGSFIRATRKLLESWGLEIDELYIDKKKNQASSEVDNLDSMEIPHDKGGRVRWKLLEKDKDLLFSFLESQVRKFILQGRPITFKELSKSGYSKIAWAIAHFYPDTFCGIAAKLTNESNTENTEFKEEEWAHATELGRKFGARWKTIIRHTGHLQTKQGKITSGQVATLYNVKEIEDFLTNWLNLPTPDKKTKEYVDSSGRRFSTAQDIARELGIEVTHARRKLPKAVINSIPGKNIKGYEVILYDKDEAIRFLDQISVILTSPEDSLLQEYTDLLLSGQIMSYAEFKRRRSNQK